jgi:hypothetical protein
LAVAAGLVVQAAQKSLHFARDKNTGGNRSADGRPSNFPALDQSHQDHKAIRRPARRLKSGKKAPAKADREILDSGLLTSWNLAGPDHLKY